MSVSQQVSRAVARRDAYLRLAAWADGRGLVALAGVYRARASREVSS